MSSDANVSIEFKRILLLKTEAIDKTANKWMPIMVYVTEIGSTQLQLNDLAVTPSE